MKKIGKLFVLLFLFCVCVGTLNVNAACASGVKVGEEFVCLASGSTQGNANGTAYPENGELVLKNYNGEKGKLFNKYFFYLFYPIHLFLLGIVALLLKG